jgi:citrate lyase subunit beta/citryl-CoA lyase
MNQRSLQITTRQIEPSVSRSWLLVNASRPELFAAAAASGADQVVLDLEDAVDASSKVAARNGVAQWLSAPGNEAWVRINDRTSPSWAEDVAELAGLRGLRGVMLAKTEEPDHVSATFEAMGRNFPILALVESAAGIENAVSVARSQGCFRLAFGAGDYRRDTGAGASDLAMAYPRSRLVVASRIGGLPGPIDGPTVGPDATVLRESSEMAVSLGMTGKLCLGVDQAQTVNEAMSPSASDVDWARNFIAEFEERGNVVRDGSDLPRLGMARKITELAASLGLDQGQGGQAPRRPVVHHLRQQPVG